MKNTRASDISLFWIILVGVILAGLIPLLVAAITDVPVIGFVLLVVLALAVSYWLSSSSGGNIQRLTAITHRIEESIEQDNQLPDVINELPTSGIREVNELSKSLRETLTALDRQITQLNTVYAISQTITSSTLDYEKTVKAVLAAVQKVVDYDAAEVSVLRGDHLVAEAWWGKEGFTDTTGRRYRVGAGPTGSIADTKQILYLPTVTDSTQDLQRTIGYASVETEFLMKTTKLVINSFLGIPLLIQDRLIGTLTMVHHQEGYFTPDDKRQLNKLADQASIAIDNALKFREREEVLQRQIAELRIAIDDEKRLAQVKEITDSEYFQELQTSAKKMRERTQQFDVSEAKSEDVENDEDAPEVNP
jgi:GAF domain-containing protein